MQPQQAQANQPVTVLANIANSGDEAGKYTATLKINGEAEQTMVGKVSAHAAVPVKFEVVKNTPGMYTVDINGQQSSFVIVDDDSKKPAPAKVWAVIGFVICAMGIVVVLVLLVQRRRSLY